MNACSGEPISWWRLERYRLRELPREEQLTIEQHLSGCALCRQCLARVDSPVQLPALPVRLTARRPARSGSARRRAWTRWIAAASTLGAAAAALLLMVRMQSPGLEPPSRRLALKGGELAIGLVRERAGSIARDSSQFAPGDRWKVLLTCPPPLGLPPLRLNVDVVVFQGGQVFFPLPPAQLGACGNSLALPGAFALDGNADVLVCAAVSERAPIEREPLRTRGLAALPALSVCTPLTSARR